MKYLLTLLSVFTISILLLNPVIAKEEVLPEFNAVDTDQDGYINRDEASQVPQIANLYQGADLDQDGKLSANEYDRAKQHVERKS
jgi:Ca2+-binding EF-hand superfamily protein